MTGTFKSSLLVAALLLTACGLWPQSAEAGSTVYRCMGPGQTCGVYVGDDTNLTFFKRVVPAE